MPFMIGGTVSSGLDTQGFGCRFDESHFESEPLHGFDIGDEFFNVLFCSLTVDDTWVSDFGETGDGELGGPCLEVSAFCW